MTCWVAIATFSSPTVAQDLSSVWRGKTVNILVGTSAGGGYDTYARMLGRFLGKHIPGNPTVVVSNMAGAASNTMAGYVASVAPKDGTYIGAPFSTKTRFSALSARTRPRRPSPTPS
jgi:tripartite-type tricarboxylate transporter receptor subunit TctC